MSYGMPPPKDFKTKPAESDFGLDPSEVAVEGIEAMQVVQDTGHTVVLIANKPTVVRVYLNRTAGSAVNLRGEIAVRRTAGGTAQNVPSLNTVNVNPAQNGQLNLKREDLALSLNFLLPASLTTAGNIIINIASLTSVPAGDAVRCSNCQTQQLAVRFVESPPLRIRLIKLRYQTFGPVVVHQPGVRDVSNIRSWLGRAYPVSNVVFSERTVEANISPPFGGSACNVANAQLAAIRNLDIDGGLDQRTHYYGMVADSGGFMRGCANNIPGVADPTAVASGPTGSNTFGWDTDGSYGDWYGGHELAHTFGRFHPGFCNGNSSDDPSFPFTSGQLSNGDGRFVGFDIGDQALGVPMKALPGQLWHDVMTYCEKQWLSSYTFEGIRRRLLAEDALGPSPAGVAGPGLEADNDALAAASEMEVNMATGDLVNIVGTVNLTQKTGKILYVNPVTKALVPVSGTEGEVQIRVKSGDNESLGVYPLRVKVNTCADAENDQTGIIDAVISSHPAARTLELIIDGQVVDTFRSAAAQPNVTNLRRAETTADVMKFAWDADEAEVENSAYNVQVSTDEGQTWETVAVGRTSPEVSIDRDQFSPGTNVMVRVIATDGFTSRVVTSDAFSIDEPSE